MAQNTNITVTGGAWTQLTDANTNSITFQSLGGRTLYVKGTVAMANSGGANSGGSQFFLVLDDVGLAPTFTVFGVVTGGFDVLETITALPMGRNAIDSIPSRPQETVYLERVEIVGG